MNASDLERLDELRKETNKLRSRLESLRNASAVSAVNYSGTGAGSGTGDPVSRAVLSVMDVEDKIRQAQAAMLDIIDTIPDAKTRKIFRRKYIDLCTWNQIADEFGYADEQGPRARVRRYKKAVRCNFRVTPERV